MVHDPSIIPGVFTGNVARGKVFPVCIDTHQVKYHLSL